MSLPKEVEERFERIEAILENAGKRLDHASEVIDRTAPFIGRGDLDPYQRECENCAGSLSQP